MIRALGGTVPLLAHERFSPLIHSGKPSYRGVIVKVKFQRFRLQSPTAASILSS
jgi:hypothetical protein